MVWRTCNRDWLELTRHELGYARELQNTRVRFHNHITWIDSSAIPPRGTLARIADAKHSIFNYNDTTLEKRTGATCSSRVVFPVSFGDSLQFVSLLLVTDL